MATVLLDFDSTIISRESLEEIMAACNGSHVLLEHVKQLTNSGMSGKLDFLSSLLQRLEAVPISKDDVAKFSQNAHQFVTQGMKELIQELMSHAIDVWIVSGAIREAILPLGEFLGIPQSRIRGVELQWSAKGLYQGIDRSNPFNRSKSEGAKELVSLWSSPVIAVGDGMTDYALYEEKVASHFIAFTQHVRRDAVVAKCHYEARSIEELRACLFSRILNIK